jgi:hypothetical protein
MNLMTIKKIITIVLQFVLVMTVEAIALPKDQSKHNYSRDDLDDLMEKVWKKSEFNLETLREYAFREKEVWDNKSRRDPSFPYLKSRSREYNWIVRSGYLVRSPALINGNELSIAEQSAAEAEWLKEQHQRGTMRSSLDLLVDFYRDREKLIGMPRYRKTPGNWEDYFLFKFKPGMYRYAGEQEFEGRKYITVKCTPRHDSIVTLSILPELHQLVRLSILTKIDSFVKQNSEMAMILDEPIKGVWLPKRYYMRIKTDARAYNTDFIYSRDFYDYVKSRVTAKFWFENVSPKTGPEMDEPQPLK